MRARSALADEVIQVAERLGAGIITALLGKGAVDGAVPYHTQQLGLLGSRPSWDMMQHCDTLLMVGTNYPYSEFLPAVGQARGVQIDLSPRHLSLRYPMEVNLWGDAEATLAALLPHLTQTDDLSWQSGVAQGMARWRQVLDKVAHTQADPLNPRLVYHVLNAKLPSNAVVTADAGTTADWYGHHIALGPDMMGNLSGRLATMLAAMPYAVAAKFAFPERPVVCTIGDGAFQMLGMNDLITVKRHWREWSNPTFVVLVLHNDDLNQVSWEMREAGDPRYDTTQLLENVDYAGYARLLGLHGIRVDDPTDVEAAWDEAFTADRPVVIDAIVDKNVPPLPAHISFDQAKSVMASLAKGDPDGAAVAGHSLRAAGAQLLGRFEAAVGRDGDR